MAVIAPDRGSVVLVNDDKGSLTRLLSAEGIPTILVGGSPESIKSILSKVKPNLILINSDNCSTYGQKICEEVKEDKRFRNIPVVFVSSQSKGKDRRNAFTYGCLDYIERPYEDENLLGKVRSYMSLGSLERSVKSLLVQMENKRHYSSNVA